MGNKLPVRKYQYRRTSRAARISIADPSVGHTIRVGDDECSTFSAAITRTGPSRPEGTSDMAPVAYFHVVKQ